MINFEVEINKLVDVEIYILRFRKIEGNPISYRDICSLLISELQTYK